MYLLRSVDVWSCAKVMGAIYGVLGLLLIPIALISVTATIGSSQQYSALGATVLIVLSLFAPVIYGFFGFLFGALTAWLYNVIARYVGGVRLQFQQESGHNAPAPSAGLG